MKKIILVYFLLSCFKLEAATVAISAMTSTNKVLATDIVPVVANAGNYSATIATLHKQVGIVAPDTSQTNANVLGILSASSVVATNTITAGSFSSIGPGPGSFALWDNAGTHNVNLTAPTSITTNLNWIYPSAPNTGVLLGTLSAGTNETLSIVSTTGSGNMMRTRTGVWRNISLPATAWMVNRTNAATQNTNVYQGTGFFDQPVYSFIGTATNRITIIFNTPEEYDAGTVKLKFQWSTTNTTGNVIWWAHGKILPDNGDPNTAWGTSVSVTDTAQTASRPLLSGATGAMTFGGTPAAGGLAIIEVYREGGNGSDTMGGWADLWTVNMGYTESATEPTAW